MNKLLTEFTGGFPFLLNDLRFTDDAIRLAIKDIVNALCGDGPVILAGCQFTQQPAYISVEEGAIFWQGEIWHVYPHNFTAPNPVLEPPYWNFVTGNGPEGSRTFENAETHQVHQIRKAVGSYLPIEGALGNLSWEIVPRLSDVNNSTKELSLHLGINLPGRANPSRSIRSGRVVAIDAGISWPMLGSTFMRVASIGLQSHFPTDIVEGICPALDNLSGDDPHVIVMFRIDQVGDIYVRRLFSGSSPAGATINLCVQYVV